MEKNKNQNVYELKLDKKIPMSMELFLVMDDFSKTFQQFFKDVQLKGIWNDEKKYESELQFVNKEKSQDTYLSLVFVEDNKFYVKEHETHPLPKNLNNVMLAILEQKVKLIENYHHISYSTLDKALTSAWTDETSSSKLWTSENPALGQSAVTSLVVQDYKKGEILNARAVLPDATLSPQDALVSHYWNKICANEVDFTKRQFPIGTIIPTGTEKKEKYSDGREYLLSLPDTIKRYENLKERTAYFLKELEK